MRKYGVWLLLILLIVGCHKKEEPPLGDVSFDEEVYRVYEPYRKGVSDSYVTSGIGNRYDIEEVEANLMALSTSYFKPNNSYYQAGQYLSLEELKLLLSGEQLNQSEPFYIGDQAMTPTYLSYLYEQNYLASNGNLKGISVALVLNPYQTYENMYGGYAYETIDEGTLLTFGKAAAQKLLAYFRTKEALQEVRIVMALYVQAGPYEIMPGRFRAIGETTESEIHFKDLNYHYQVLPSEYVLQHDIDIYNGFLSLQKMLKERNRSFHVTGRALYENDRLQKIDLTITSTYLNRGDLYMVSTLVGEQIGQVFGSTLPVRVKIEVQNQVEALIVKNQNELKSNVTIVKG